MTDRQDDSGALRERLDSFVTEMEACDRRYGEPVRTYTRKLRHILNSTAALSPQGSEPAGMGDDYWAQQRYDDLALATPAPAQQAVTDEMVERVAIAIYGARFGFSGEQAAKCWHASGRREELRLAREALNTTAQGDSDA